MWNFISCQKLRTHELKKKKKLTAVCFLRLMSSPSQSSVRFNSEYGCQEWNQSLDNLIEANRGTRAKIILLY